MECAFPLCTRHAESNSYCIFHKIYGKQEPEKVKVYVIPKRSEKQKKVMAELRKLYPVFLEKHPLCEVRLSPDCTKIATCIHHVRGRLKDNLFNVKSWKSCCETCNLRAETHHKEAEEAGMKKSKFKTG